MTDQEIFAWGDMAHMLITTTDYVTLYEKITMDIAKEILATGIGEQERRNDLYATYNGMRDFGFKLNQMIALKDQLIEMQEAEEAINTDEDESN